MKAKIIKLLRRIFGSDLELIFSKYCNRYSDFLCFVSRNKEIAIAYGDYDAGFIVVFLDQKTGEEISCMNIEGHNVNENFSFSFSGEEVIFVRDGYYLDITDREKKVFCENFGKVIDSPSFSPSGEEIMFVEGRFGERNHILKILDRKTKEELLSMIFEASDCSPSFSPSREEIMLPRGNRNLTVLDRETGKEIFSKDFKERIGSPSFSPSGKEIVLSKYQRILTVLDSKTGEEIFSKEFKERIFSLSFSPSGKRVMFKEGDNKLRILDSKTGEEIFSKKIEDFSNPIFGEFDEVIIIRIAEVGAG